MNVDQRPVRYNVIIAIFSLWIAIFTGTVAAIEIAELHRHYGAVELGLRVDVTLLIIVCVVALIIMAANTALAIRRRNRR